MKPPVFDDSFQAQLTTLMEWRRDVRRFRPDVVPQHLIERLLDVMQLSPSVGNSQPWRWMNVQSQARRQLMKANFASANASALKVLHGEKAALYARLKLSGMDIAPVQLACFCDRYTVQGAGLGRRTMPETLELSVAGMISNFWLAARAMGLGVGWVSILNPTQAAIDLDAPTGWKLIAYLCIGWPEEEHADPELVRAGWQDRTAVGRQVLER